MHLLNISLLIFILTVQTACTSNQNFKEEKIIKNLFLQNNITNATIVIQQPNSKIIGYNQTRAITRFVPGSIFKIPNSIIALSENIVPNTDDIFFIYSGQKVFLDIWTNNMNLRDAFKTSNVPAFQEIATKEGLPTIQRYLQQFNYGNMQTGQVVDRFWLDGPLKISAIEHVKFLDNLLNNKFGLNTDVLHNLKEISFMGILDNDWKLYGKTGWANKVGWFAGWVEKNGELYIFTTNIDIADVKNLPLREKITKEILIKIIK